MASIVHSRMARLYAGPRSIIGSFDPSLSQTFVTAELSLDSCSLAADAAGLVLSYLGAMTTLTVRVAGRIDSGWTVSKADGAGITSTLSGSTVTVTNLTADFATITLTATKSGYSGVTKTFAVSRVKQGAKGEDGVSGDSVDIVYRRDVFQPPTPAASSGTPPYWYSDVASVPAGSGSIWSSVGRKPSVTSSFTWSLPIKIEGSDGVSGLSIVELTIFMRAASAPTAPSGGTYNFSTKALTPPSGWSIDVPAGTDPVYTSRATVSSADPAATSVSVAGWTTPSLSFQNGEDGEDGVGQGQFKAVAFLRATAESVTAPTGGTFGAPTPSGWSDGIPSGTYPLWQTTRIFTSDGLAPQQAAWTTPQKVANTSSVKYQFSVDNATWGDTASVSSIYMRTGTSEDGGTTWVYSAGVKVKGEKGEDGAGDSVDIVFLRATTQPATPAASVSTPADWYSNVASVPAGIGSIWSSVGKKATAETNYTWQTPLKVEGSDGVSGLSIVELTIFIRATSTPATPSGGTYNFSTKALTPPSGWSVAVPSGTDPVYTSRATVSSSNPAATAVAVTGWTAPVVSFQNGTNGSNGTNGTNGTRGTRGTVQLIAYGTSWSDTTANSTITSATGSSTRIIGDIVTITNNTSFSQTRAWSGSSWVAASAYINGDMIVSGALVADQIAAGTMTGSTVRTSSGTTRVEMSASDNSLSVWVSGSQRLKIGGSGDAWMTGTSGTLPAIYITSTSLPCIEGSSSSSYAGALNGSNSSGGYGVEGECSSTGAGVFGENTSTGKGVWGKSKSGSGVFAQSTTGYGLWVESGGAYIKTNCTITGQYQTAAGTAYFRGSNNTSWLEIQSTGNAFQFRNSASVWAFTGNTSDRRLKANIRDTASDGLSMIDALRVVDFEWKPSAAMYDHGVKHTGLIAQEVQEVFPTSVSEGYDTLFLHKQELVPILIKAIQELHAQVATLKQEIETLKGEQP